MRLIVHLDDPEDLIFAMCAVRTSIREGYKDCAYGYGEPEKASAYVRSNKTGWSIWITRSPTLSTTVVEGVK